MLIQQPKLFNPEGNDDSYSIWKGTTTGVINLNDPVYQWATQVYDQMLNNFWHPGKVDLSIDRTQYLNNLLEGERRAFYGILSYLTFLDSIQTRFLPAFQIPIISPEVSLVINQQAFQEGLHNKSYQVMIEGILPTEEREGVYQFCCDNDALRKRCQFITNYYQTYRDNPTEENYFITIVADYLLEGLYFMNGFQFFYNLASRQLMPGSADMVKLINR